MKQEFARMIKESVHDLFVAFLDMEVTPGPMVTKKEDDLYRPPDTEVTAIINFSGGLQGGVHLASPRHTAMQLCHVFAGEEFQELFGEAGDAFGELNNVIAGGLQTRLSEQFGNINLTPPTLIAGTDYKMQYKTNFHSIKQYFKCEHGPFFVEFFFHLEGYTP
ncbi:MAG: putative chemotaxis protein CheX [Magnetococcales bacterium]|nr:putative chemotaxis protein CheX [Magnetococcales bacterium]HIJ83400.1 chemotaxis protein CheX [Magnetococcales bacterium]